MIDPSLKILFCAFQVIPEPSGASTRVAGFLRALQGKCTVDALTAKSPEVAHIERFFGARLMRVPVGSGDLAARSQAFERAVTRQLESDEYNIVQFSDPFAGTSLLDHKSKLRFKAVYDASVFPSFDLRYTDPHLEGDRNFMAKLKRAELLCLMGADAVLTASPVHRDHIATLGVPKAKITVISPAVELKTFEKFGAARPDRIPMRLLYLGSQVAWQGLPTLLFAMKDALKQPAAGGVRLSIVGPRHPDWRDQLEEQVKASGLAGNVDFQDPPTREDLPRLIAQHDVGVAPLEKSDRTQQMGGLVMKIADYAAAGRAIIASDLPVTRALLDERAALFFAPSREAALAQAIVTLAKDPARRVQMGQAARTLAAERFDDLHAGEQLLGVYEAFALSGSGVRPREDVEVPTSIGAENPADAPTGSGRARAQTELEPSRTADADTGKIRLPSVDAEVRASLEPTPVAPASVLKRDTGAIETGPEIAAAPPAPREPDASPAEPTPAEPLAAAEPSRTGVPTPLALFSDDGSADATGELPDLPGPSGMTALGDILTNLDPVDPPIITTTRAPPIAATVGPPILDPAANSIRATLKPASRPSTGASAPPVLLSVARPATSPTAPPVLVPASEARPQSARPAALSVNASIPVLAPVAPSIPVLTPVAPAAAARAPSVSQPAVVAGPPVLPRSTVPLAVAVPPPTRPPALTPAGVPRPAPASVAAALRTPDGPPLLTRAPSGSTAAVATAPAVAAAPVAPKPNPARPASLGAVMLGDEDFSPVEAEPEFIEADAVQPVEPPPRPVLQNSVDLGGPDAWVHSLVLGFAPLGQLGAAPLRGSPLSTTEPPKV